jgi:hypothetical protein
MLVTGQRYAEDVLKVAGTPTFFVNGDMIVGEAAFEGIRQAHQNPVEKLIRPPDSLGSISPAKGLGKAP